MPMNRKLYPKNWREISSFIRFERAKGKCEECGAPHNGLRDGAQYFDESFAESFPHLAEEMTRIVLTTAHLGIDKPDGTPGDRSDTMDCRPENRSPARKEVTRSNPYRASLVSTDTACPSGVLEWAGCEASHPDNRAALNVIAIFAANSCTNGLPFDFAELSIQSAAHCNASLWPNIHEAKTG